MEWLGVGIWLACSMAAYFVAEVAVLCCDRRQWNHLTREIIAVYCLILGPIALIIFLEMLIFAERGKDLNYHPHTLHPRH